MNTIDAKKMNNATNVNDEVMMNDVMESGGATDARGMKTVAVGLSGGVDSTYVAWLMKQQGYRVIGLTMWHFDIQDPAGKVLRPSYVEEAAQIAAAMGIEHHVLDFREIFKNHVIDPFLRIYAAGGTPNPCALCNPTVKYGALLEAARSFGAEILATGHYARITRDETNGRYRVFKGIAHRKDQSYLMHGLSQEQLSFIHLPLSGIIDKSETRNAVATFMPEVSGKKDSTDICFIPEGHPGDYVKACHPEAIEEGWFVDTEGKQLDRHKGFPYYTLGQRRGLSVKLGKPMYVIGFESDENLIVLSDDEADLYRDRVYLKGVNYIPEENPPERFKCIVRIFQWGHDLPAEVIMKTGGEAEVNFDIPARGPVVGQYAVFYREDEVLGGGIINSVG